MRPFRANRFRVRRVIQDDFFRFYRVLYVEKYTQFLLYIFFLKKKFFAHSVRSLF